MLADRTLVMLDGRVIESGLTDQILKTRSTPTPSSSSIRFCSPERISSHERQLLHHPRGTVVCADRVLPDHDVVVIDGRIAAIEPAGASDFDAQPDAAVGVLPIMDARGAFVAPGLIDIHSDYVENVASRARAWSWT